MLSEHPNVKVTVFAVWEPILPTDWMPPTTGTLGRLSDRRVTQFWDKNHVVAQVLAESRLGKPEPNCCTRRGTLWDLIAVYPPGPEWRAMLPAATVFDGPVVRVLGFRKIF
jgi:hypothetical protein